MERIEHDRCYEDAAFASPFDRFGLWAPVRRPDGEHRFAFVKQPDGYANHVRLAAEVARLQEENPGENIFVAGLADHRPEYLGLDYWPMGLITPKDFHICFRFRNGLHNPGSGQAWRYARARLKHLGAAASRLDSGLAGAGG